MDFCSVSILQALQEQLTSTVQEIGHLIDPVSTAAKGEASQLGHKVDIGQGLWLSNNYNMNNNCNICNIATRL